MTYDNRFHARRISRSLTVFLLLGLLAPSIMFAQETETALPEPNIGVKQQIEQMYQLAN